VIADAFAKYEPPAESNVNLHSHFGSSSCSEVQSCVRSAGEHIQHLMEEASQVRTVEWPHTSEAKAVAACENLPGDVFAAFLDNLKLNEHMSTCGADTGPSNELSASGVSNAQHAWGIRTKLSEVHACLRWKVNKSLSPLFHRYMSTDHCTPISMKSLMLLGELHKNGSVVECEANFGGLMVLDTDVEYPSHAHEAGEFFYIVQGSALWSQPAKPWIFGDGDEAVNDEIVYKDVVVHPGAVVYHAPGIPHKVSTFGLKQPLIAAYWWWGDVHGRYNFCDPLPTQA